MGTPARSKSSRPPAKRAAAKRPPQKRTTSAKRAPARRAPARRKAPRRRSEPLLTPRQIGDLTGIGLIGLGVFGALVLWFGIDGAAGGRALGNAAHVGFGSFAIFLPLVAVAAGLAVFSHGRRLPPAPAVIGAALIAFAVLLAVSNSQTHGAEAEAGGGLVGGTLRNVLHGAVGTIGIRVAILFLLLGGVMLVSGASVGIVLRAITREITATVIVLREAAADRGLERELRDEAASRPRRPRPARPVAEPVSEPSLDPPSASFTGLPPLGEGTPTDDPTPEPVAIADPEPSTAPEPTADPTDGEDEATLDYGPAPATEYRLPDSSALTRSKPMQRSAANEERVAAALIEALGHHGVEARLVGTVSGPRVTRYEIQLAPGTKVGKVSALRDDLAYALATTEIRILAPIPGKQAVGVEVPNLSPNLVTLGDINGPFPQGSSPLTVWLGKDISGNAVSCDLARMPHILIAGTTGSGKSGCVNAMLTSILLHASPEQVRMILIDPKKVELNHYEAIPHLLTPVVTNPKQAAAALLNSVTEMERRYEMLGAARARNIGEFNKARVEAGRETLPYVLVVIDELADLMMVSPAEVEDAIIRLAQKSRAVGIHLVLATQRPSVDVITGMIKANVPSRIAFAVSSMTDSRVILDTGGAESLLGSGDMLYRPLGTSRLLRTQGAFVTEEEIAVIVQQCRDQREPEFEQSLLDLPEISSGGGDERGEDDLDPDRDDLLADAIRCVVNHETASVSLLQRRLRVGYTRAGRLIDMLERRGVISGYEGSKPRQVLITEADLPRLLDE